MKYISIGLPAVLVLLFTTCVSSQIKPDTSSNALLFFQNYVNSLDPNDLLTLDKSVTKYKQLFEKSSVSKRDTAFIIFWRYYVTVADSLGAKYVQDEKYHLFFNIKNFDEASSKNEKLKQNLINKNKNLNESDFKMLKRINYYGYKFDMIEGVILVSIADPKFILNNLSGFISQALKSYIVKVIEEIDTAGNSDTAQAISPDELANRLLWWENFINNNQEFFLIDDCFQTYDGYLYTLMQGTDNNPAFNYNDQKLNEKFRKVYEKIINHHKGTGAAEVIAKYYNILKKNNFFNSKEAIKFAEQFLGE